MTKYLKGIYSSSDFFEFDKKIVLFLGRSNVGKSSLINSLLKKKLAKTSSVPGKTVAVHIFLLDEIYLIDLPGYGYAKRSHSEIDKFATLSTEFMNFAKKYDPICLLLIDSKVGITKDDFLAIEYLKNNNFNFYIVLTKTDKTNQSLLYKSKKEVEKVTLNYFETSSFKNKGIDKLREKISQLLGVIKWEK